MSILDCHDYYNTRVHHALSYLPKDVFDKHVDTLAIVGMGHRDAVHLTAKTRKHEVIVLSDRILPRRKAQEDSPEVRYFNYAVLHEVAHAVCKHRPPDDLTREEAAAQEAEADGLAMKWFNDHVAARNIAALVPMTKEELDGHEARSKKLMEEAYQR